MEVVAVCVLGVVFGAAVGRWWVPAVPVVLGAVWLALVLVGDREDLKNSSDGDETGLVVSLTITTVALTAVPAAVGVLLRTALRKPRPEQDPA